MDLRVSMVKVTFALLACHDMVPAVTPTAVELDDARSWLVRQLATDPPFSFTFAGRPSADLLKKWKFQKSTRQLDVARTEHVFCWQDMETSLTVRMAAIEYHRYPTVEWTLYLRNDGQNDTPFIEKVQPLDLNLKGDSRSEFVLYHQTGSPCLPEDYQPHELALRPKSFKRISAAGGRPTNSDLPYFNLRWADHGLIIVVGWPGQWSAEFTRDEKEGLGIRAGQEVTHLVLHPGEEIRAPLIVLQFDRGDRFRAQNIWRRWMIAHNLPRPAGKLVPTHYASCWGNMQPRATEENAIIDGFVREGVKLDYWILDAGWYPGEGTWVNTGTWEPAPERFPGGLREVADRAHAAEMKFVVWFEPERVRPGTRLYKEHPEWMLGVDGQEKLLNLGDPQARQWLVDYIDRFLGEQRIDVYRQDFNIDPLKYWQSADAPDRQGMTEIRYVTGYLAWWDELLKRRPGLWIDSCASGGRRNDLETLRRAVPLLRSDYYGTPEAQQAQTWGISLWMPYYGSGLGANDTYWFRSCIFPASRVGLDTRRKDYDYAFLKRMIAEFRRVEPYLLGDFWPLTPWSLDRAAWIAWQFDQPEIGAGFVQVFRRPESPYETAVFPLRGLEADAVYEVIDFDDENPVTMNGRELADRGLPVTLRAKSTAGIFVYKKIVKPPDSEGYK